MDHPWRSAGHVSPDRCDFDSSDNHRPHRRVCADLGFRGAGHLQERYRICWRGAQRVIASSSCFSVVRRIANETVGGDNSGHGVGKGFCEPRKRINYI